MLWPKLVLSVAALGAGLWWLGPRESATLGPVEVSLPDDLDAWAAATEADVKPGQQRRILWAGEPGQQTELALVYLHGFSASPLEISPVVENVAHDLGANLYFARLAGHGLDGDALARATVAEWWRDTAEAVAVGRRIGQRVILIGTSTGGTLAAEAARDPDLGPMIDGVVLISPNFRLKNPGARYLTWPFARWWAPFVAGRKRCFQPLNERHGQAWTSCYPMVATLPMAALVAGAQRGSYAAAPQPALFIWADADQVVDAAATRTVADGWGGTVTRHPVEMGQGDDPASHVIAGDILSPGMTGAIAQTMTAWIRQAFAGGTGR